MRSGRHVAAAGSMGDLQHEVMPVSSWSPESPEGSEVLAPHSWLPVMPRGQCTTHVSRTESRGASSGFIRGHYVTVTLLCANQAAVLQPISGHFMDNLHYP